MGGKNVSGKGTQEMKEINRTETNNKEPVANWQCVK